MDIEKQNFIDHLRKSIGDDSFVRMTLGKYRGDDKEFENIFVSRLETREGEKLSLKLRYKTKDIVKNYDFEKGIKLVEEITGKDFLSATLFTTANDISLDYSKKRVPSLHIKKPTQTEKAAAVHNKVKSRFANEQAEYFRQLGITGREGKVKADKYDKFRQVDKFIEIMDSLYRSSELSEKNELRIIDMGSGKSYTTFAVYDYFTNTLHKKVYVKGIEQREELVDLSNKIAGECGFENLKFIKGTIEDFTKEDADIVIALHACDTATDDAIVTAIRSNAEINILAPCCHKYLRKKIRIPELMKPVYRHGILEERLSITLTDGLRAMVMESFGYDTKIFEFISSEHTAKNTMITAVKNKSFNDKENKLAGIEKIKDEFGIDDFYLDKKIFS